MDVRMMAATRNILPLAHGETRSTRRRPLRMRARSSVMAFCWYFRRSGGGVSSVKGPEENIGRDGGGGRRGIV